MSAAWVGNPHLRVAQGSAEGAIYTSLGRSPRLKAQSNHKGLKARAISYSADVPALFFSLASISFLPSRKRNASICLYVKSWRPY